MNLKAQKTTYVCRMIYLSLALDAQSLMNDPPLICPASMWVDDGRLLYVRCKLLFDLPNSLLIAGRKEGAASPAQKAKDSSMCLHFAAAAVF